MAYPDEGVLKTWLHALSDLNVRVKPMFGCYCVYVDDCPVGWLSERAFSLREVGLDSLPSDLRRPQPTDRIREIVIPLDLYAAPWLARAVQETADVLNAQKKQ